MCRARRTRSTRRHYGSSSAVWRQYRRQIPPNGLSSVGYDAIRPCTLALSTPRHSAKSTRAALSLPTSALHYMYALHSLSLTHTALLCAGTARRIKRAVSTCMPSTTARAEAALATPTALVPTATAGVGTTVGWCTIEVRAPIVCIRTRATPSASSGQQPTACAPLLMVPAKRAGAARAFRGRRATGAAATATTSASTTWTAALTIRACVRVRSRRAVWATASGQRRGRYRGVATAGVPIAIMAMRMAARGTAARIIRTGADCRASERANCVKLEGVSDV